MTVLEKCTEWAFSLAVPTISTLAMYPDLRKSINQRRQILQINSFEKLPNSLNILAKIRHSYGGVTGTFPLIPMYPIADQILDFSLNKIKKTRKRDPNLTEKLFATLVTSGLITVVANPCEIAIIAHLKYRTSPREAVKKISFKNLYTGFSPMLLRNWKYISLFFLGQRELEKQLEEIVPGTGKTHKMFNTFMSSAGCAASLTILLAPYDIAAIIRQADPECKIHQSAWQAIKAAWKKHGLGAFKTGMRARLVGSTKEMIVYNLLMSTLKKDET